MSIEPQSADRIQSSIVDALLAIVIAVLLASFSVLFPWHIAFALSLLVGIWWIDVYLKRVLRFENITVFADLSFSCLVLVGSQAISLAVKNDNVASDNYRAILTQIVGTTLILFVLWLGNLSVCRWLDTAIRPAKDRRKTWLWLISFLIAFLSVCGSLYVFGLET